MTLPAAGARETARHGVYADDVLDARPVIERILTINQAIRDEAFAGMPAHARDTVINILDGIKDNLALQEEAADSPAAAIHGI